MDRPGIDGVLRRHASWDGHVLAFAGGPAAGDGATPYLLLADVQVEGGVPVLDGEKHDIPVSVLLWPVEQLLVRHFSLPLANPRLLDADILTQELCEQAGDTASDHWLAWHAGNDGTGVEGLVFGLPQRLREAIAALPAWRDCAVIAPDAWVRLAAWPEAIEPEAACVAVLDEDREGLFVGVRGPAAWRGMRRINRTPWRSDGDMAEDALRTLTAMGWRAEIGGLTGRLSEGLLQRLSERPLRWHGRQEDGARLPDRHQANLDAASLHQRIDLNFRHGAWRKPGDISAALRRWRHTLVFLGVVVIAALAGGIWQMISLERQADVYRGEITAAFHRGLPDEKVMLDPLAQLRMAARGGIAEAGSDDFMRRLSVLAKVKQSLAGWHIREIDYGDDGMRLFGVAGDFAIVNRVRDALADGGARDVRIEDTEARDKQVSFRIRWP
ncbi:MAG TPA: type II secretion system protein GspL [Mariprofundaceae bacterium]|nr:type II secretion system protein GspL [Mariprofundaceae bacterium]